MKSRCINVHWPLNGIMNGIVVYYRIYRDICLENKSSMLEFKYVKMYDSDLVFGGGNEPINIFGSVV